MYEFDDTELNSMAIAIAKTRGIRIRMIKLKKMPRSKANRENFFQSVTFSWCPYMDEAKEILKVYHRELENPRIRPATNC